MPIPWLEWNKQYITNEYYKSMLDTQWSYFIERMMRSWHLYSTEWREEKLLKEIKQEVSDRYTIVSNEEYNKIIQDRNNI